MIQIRRKLGEPEQVDSIKTLRQMVRDGTLLDSDLVLFEDDWMVAKDVPMLSGVFTARIWDMPEDAIWTPSLSPASEATKPLEDSALPVESTSEKKPLPKLPLSAIQPLDTDEDVVSTDPSPSSSPSPRSDIIKDYQQSKPITPVIPSDQTVNSSPVSSPSRPPKTVETLQSTPPSLGTPLSKSEMWNPEADLRDQPGLWADVAPPPKRQFSWLRLSLMVVPGAFIIFLARAFVISEAQTEFPLDTDLSENAPIPKELVTDPLLELEDKLKSRLRRDTQSVTPEQSLSDALRVDLEFVGLEIVRLDTKVLSWTGRKLDQPKSASIKVYLDPSESFEEDLLLATLVIAKYAVRYYLEMENFDVFLKVDDGYIQKTIPTEQARFLLLQPGSLKSFLLSLSEK